MEAHEAQSHDSANYHGGITDTGPACCRAGSGSGPGYRGHEDAGQDKRNGL